MTNEIQTVNQNTGLQVQNFQEGMRLAEMMSQASLVPQHLQGKPADCLLIVEQASRWQMSPFAVAQSTSSIRGKLMFEGKLVAAVVNNSGKLQGSLRYDYSDNGNAITVSGRLKGETADRTINGNLNDLKTDNGQWKKNPQQMLAYAGARIWARRHMPEVIYGISCPEEFGTQEQREIKDVTPKPQEQMSAMGFDMPTTQPQTEDKYEAFCQEIMSAKTEAEITAIGKRANKELEKSDVVKLSDIAKKRKEELAKAEVIDVEEDMFPGDLL